MARREVSWVGGDQEFKFNTYFGSKLYFPTTSLGQKEQPPCEGGFARCPSLKKVKPVVVHALLTRPPNVSIPAGEIAEVKSKNVLRIRTVLS